MFGTPSEHWAERLQTQPQLSSSSSVTAEEFPARVLQQIVSHHLRCLCKYPSTAVRKHSTPSDEKKRSTTVQKLQETLNERPYSLLLMIGKSLSSFLLINTQYWWSFGTCNTACLVYQSENVNLTITCQPHTWLLHPQTLTVHDFTDTFTSLWGATVSCINRVGLIHDNHVAGSFFSLPTERQ